jgi:non-specific serine/threonine protein kinase
MVLYCEMGNEQRKIYEAFKNEYRDKLMGLIDTEGMNKSRMHILEGLLKLRQICDSPLLLSNDGDFGSDSVKLEEITREIEENAGHHKILVFSQFLKMLGLIRGKLEELNIGYEYLDGSVQDRKERVEHFQSDPDCRVFLISLRTGGWGINLTEADYVYIVDPWWNPAVEQQAIDRTHRIGQTQKVFAYKMICKDTVEEKIMMLQESKKQLATELISTESGFLKSLSRDDILMLFS